MPVALRYRNRFRPDDEQLPERIGDEINAWLKDVRGDGAHTKMRVDGAKTEESVVYAELSSGVSNWNISGLRDATLVRIQTSSTALPEIRGIVPVRDHQIVRFLNESSNIVIWREESTSGAEAECRIVLDGTTGTSMPPNGVMRLYYDPASSRWRLLDRSF